MTKIAGSGSESGSISQKHGSEDPDPLQNVMDPEHWYTCTAKFIRFSQGCGSRSTFSLEAGSGSALKSKFKSFRGLKIEQQRAVDAHNISLGQKGSPGAWRFPSL